MPKFIEITDPVMIQGGKTPALPRGSRGMQISVPLGAYGQAPQIDRRAIVGAQLDSAEAYGKAGQAVGGAMMVLANEQFKAINETKVMEAEARMVQGKAEVAEALANESDVLKWKEVAAKKAAEISKSLFTKDLSTDARNEIERRSILWSQNLVSDAHISSVRRSFQVRNEMEGVTFLQALANRDFTTSERVRKTMIEQNHVGPQAAFEMQQQEFKARTTALSAEADLRLSNRDINGAKAVYETAEMPSDMSGGQWLEFKKLALQEIEVKHATIEEQDKADQMEQENPAELVKQLEGNGFSRIQGADRAKKLAEARKTREYMADMEAQAAERAIALLPPDKVKDATIESLGVPLKQATPWHRAVIEQKLELRKDPTGERFTPRFQSLYAEAGRAVPTGDEEADAIRDARLMMAAEALPAPMTAKIKAKMEEAQKAGGSVPLVAGLIAKATESAKAASEMPVTTADGKPVLRDAKVIGKTPVEPIDWWFDRGGEEVKENDGKPIPLKSSDPAKLKQYSAALEKVTEQLEKEAANPKTRELWEQNPDMAEKRLETLMTRFGVPIIAPANQPPPIAPTKPVGGGMDVSNPLLPPINDILKANGY